MDACPALPTTHVSGRIPGNQSKANCIQKRNGVCSLWGDGIPPTQDTRELGREQELAREAIHTPTHAGDVRGEQWGGGRPPGRGRRWPTRAGPRRWGSGSGTGGCGCTPCAASSGPPGTWPAAARDPWAMGWPEWGPRWPLSAGRPAALTGGCHGQDVSEHRQNHLITVLNRGRSHLDIFSI